MRCCTELTSEHQRALHLHFGERRRPAEVATAMGLPLEQVEPLVKRAVRAARAVASGRRAPDEHADLRLLVEALHTGASRHGRLPARAWVCAETGLSELRFARLMRLLVGADCIIGRSARVAGRPRTPPWPGNARRRARQRATEDGRRVRTMEDEGPRTGDRRRMTDDPETEDQDRRRSMQDPSTEDGCPGDGGRRTLKPSSHPSSASRPPSLHPPTSVSKGSARLMLYLRQKTSNQGCSMTEVNINNPPQERVVVERDRTDRTSAAVINFLTVLLVVVAVIAILWFLWTGPLHAAMYPVPPLNINVTPRP